MYRTPMQWDASPHAGFSSAEPWLPVSDDHSRRNVAVQTGDATSILNLYRRLIWYRRGHASLSDGSYRALDLKAANCFVYLRETVDERHLVALNFSDKPVTIELPGGGTGKLVLSTYLDREVSELALDQLNLRPNEGLLIKLV